MADVRPFRALRPENTLAGEVIAPPYDVLNEEEARAIATNRKSFLRVTRSEVDLPEGSDSHSDEAYAKARENLDAFIADGTMRQDAEPTYYFYGQKMGEHTQVGVIAACSVDEYDNDLIAKHEFTRPDKEDDRTHHMGVLDAQVGLVFLAHKPSTALAELAQQVTAGEPEWSVTTDDGVKHTLWAAPQELVEPIREAFAALPKLYVADGHHRSAAASRMHALRQNDHTSHFIAGLFPSDRLQVLAYNRVVHDLNGLSSSDFLAQVGERFDMKPSDSDTPAERGQYTMYIDGQWYLLTLKPELRKDDPVGRLDAAALQDNLLSPLLGIEDPRRSNRITFVGGIHGAARLKKMVDAGKAVAFHLFPTGLDQLFDVADAGKVMPPKSTWFEPKLRGGVAVRLLREL